MDQSEQNDQKVAHPKILPTEPSLPENKSGDVKAAQNSANALVEDPEPINKDTEFIPTTAASSPKEGRNDQDETQFTMPAIPESMQARDRFGLKVPIPDVISLRELAEIDKASGYNNAPKVQSNPSSQASAVQSRAMARAPTQSNREPTQISRRQRRAQRSGSKTFVHQTEPQPSGVRSPSKTSDNTSGQAADIVKESDDSDGDFMTQDSDNSKEGIPTENCSKDVKGGEAVQTGKEPSFFRHSIFEKHDFENESSPVILRLERHESSLSPLSTRPGVSKANDHWLENGFFEVDVERYFRKSSAWLLHAFDYLMNLARQAITIVRDFGDHAKSITATSLNKMAASFTPKVTAFSILTPM